MPRLDAKYLTKVCVFAVVYFISARLGLSFQPVSGVASPVWPATGIALAVLMLLGPELWPGLLIGATATNLSVGVPIAGALIMGLGNTLESVVAIALLRRVGFRPPMDRLRDVLSFLSLAAIVCTMISATGGVLGLRVGGVHAGLSRVWWVWWLGDLIGALLIGTFLLVWAGQPRPGWDRRRMIEGATILATQTVLCVLVIRLPGHLASYTLYPLLIALAVLFGQRGAVVGTFVTSSIAIWGTWHGSGPFVGPSPIESLVRLQGFMGVLSVSLLVLGAAVEERHIALNAREQILAVVSHDLGNILSSIQLRGATLARKIKGSTNAETLQPDIDQVLRSTDRMRRLIRDLVDTSAIQSGRLGLNTEPQSPVSILEEAAQTLRQGPEITLRAESLFVSDPPAVACDRDRILQVLSNLVTNAAKVMPEGGTISLRVELRDRGVLFSVADTGPGIHPHEQQIIFERFRRGAHAGYEGLGLGLAICKGIVEAHGGTIWVESRLGSGATFFFSVPALSNAEQGSARQPIPIGPART